ncbi:XdhC domains-containing protein [Desulfonema limicola]|uniref:XdhC domains-containing protein n=1 Tax=Desulfonema limicola TaxID=45656 RepID=A0A975GG72_9BACT|nr:XdhC/CoxI family protein [Desulfonema limicola]QTA79948.1 XdhC domains-containing protein [Desulfonema limicola]
MSNDIYNKVCGQLEMGEELVLATVISQHGSTPRTAGTQMVITKDGKSHGTIGGGLLEARVTKMGKEAISGRYSRVVFFDLTHRDIAAMDMICGGSVEVFLDYLSPDTGTISLFNQLKLAREQGKTSLFLMIIQGSGEEIHQVDRCLAFADGSVTGSFTLSPSALDKVMEKGQSTPFMKIIRIEDALVVIQPTEKPKTLYLLGAGHVAQPTAHMAAMVGFRVVVMDDREEFANETRFPGAYQIIVPPDFDRALSNVEIDSDSYVVIVTRGHLHDRTVLIQALKTNAAYIGMIGSRRKRDALFNALLKQGFTQDDINRVFSPIGLDIKAETPEEIGVSIVSELILERAKKRK